MSLPLDPQPFAGPLGVTLAYLVLYYAAVVRVARTRARLHREYRSRGEKFDRYLGGDREMLATDRVHLNILEHMPPFLVLLWLHAAFVSPLGATVAGSVYVLARAIHPLMIGRRLGRDIRLGILAVTVPGYLVLLYLLLGLTWRLL